MNEIIMSAIAWPLLGFVGATWYYNSLQKIYKGPVGLAVWLYLFFVTLLGPLGLIAIALFHLFTWYEQRSS